MARAGLPAEPRIERTTAMAFSVQQTKTTLDEGLGRLLAIRSKFTTRPCYTTSLPPRSSKHSTLT